MPQFSRRQEIRTVIDTFITERLNAKLDGLPADDPKREALTAQYATTSWLEDAARRAGQIQAVTHTLKAIHPDAKGTNLYCLPSDLPKYRLVGSHCLDENFAGDVVGNAAALDVYKFLKQEHDGQSLLTLLLANDADTLAALDDNADKARALAESFTSITQPRGGLASHTHGKQLYWLAGDDPHNDEHFHLLMPLYASSLAHRVYQTIQTDRFSDSAKEVRDARRSKQMHAGVIREYPQLAVRKLGGTKPQNISQLNSERRGENYLLASLPPTWQQSAVRLPIKTRDGSIFPGFGLRPAVRELVSTLREFLLSGPPANVHVRNSRDELITELIDELLQYAVELWTFTPGWSASADCNLNRAEQLWLDFRRAEQDELFASEWQRMEWVGEIRERFAQWLNARLMKNLSVGDVEHSYWARQFGRDALWLDLNWLSDAWLKRFEREQSQQGGADDE
ncbi:type I-F CRISPR-associated protein Csy1 [Pseudomonas sp. LRF_L74]|uniref:type I-F CRISPR-associated protein Csy1 n=1 Tax=Pseudomonas sp. LRF_L74 TaxID=3369422 RepID=UPI003F63740D